MYRKQPAFLEDKYQRTSDLIKAMLGSVPNLFISHELLRHVDKTDNSFPFWMHDPDLFEMDSNCLFCMRGATTQQHPGLNMLFNGQKLAQAMKHMTRSMRVNGAKWYLVVKFLMCPVGQMWRHIKGSDWQKNNGGQLGPLPSIIHYIRRETGRSHRWIGWVIFSVWLLLTYTVGGGLVLRLSSLHQLEPVIALLYYVWASCIVAIEVANEVSKLPSDLPFKLAYKQATLSSTEIEMTRIEDGQPYTVTAMGCLQMVCRLYPRSEDAEDDEDEDEEDNDEGPDPFNIGRGALDLAWEQRDPCYAVPFAHRDTTNANLFYLYQVSSGPINHSLDWEDRDHIYMQVGH